MKFRLLFLFSFLLIYCSVFAQDTFSIVAVDEETGEVGSAGASCVELSNFNLPPDFLGVLFPGVGAINSQAYYLPQNQDNATARMNAGDTPQEIIDWLVANDVQNNPSFRQYGVVRIIDGQGYSAAHTGTNTDDYKGHRTGSNYSIQGNILLGPEILDSMEANFVNTEGPLAYKLMAAMQGANVAGADTRCFANGTSSLFAFLKVAQPDDNFGDPSLVLGVDFFNNTGMEPIDSLQTLFDEAFPPLGTTEPEAIQTSLFPNPAREEVFFRIDENRNLNELVLSIFTPDGKVVLVNSNLQHLTSIRNADLGRTSNLFFYQLKNKTGQILASGKLTFFN